MGADGTFVDITYRIIGLKSDGAVVDATLDDAPFVEPNDMSCWYYLGRPPSDTYIKLKHAQQTFRREQWKQRGLCPCCGGPIGGLFTKKCKSCGKTQ